MLKAASIIFLKGQGLEPGVSSSPQQVGDEVQLYVLPATNLLLLLAGSIRRAKRPRTIWAQLKTLTAREIGYENHPTRCLPDSYSGPKLGLLGLLCKPPSGHDIVLTRDRTPLGLPYALGSRRTPGGVGRGEGNEQSKCLFHSHWDPLLSVGVKLVVDCRVA